MTLILQRWLNSFSSRIQFSAGEPTTPLPLNFKDTVEGAKPRGSRSAPPDGTLISDQPAELADDDGGQCTGSYPIETIFLMLAFWVLPRSF